MPRADGPLSTLLLTAPLLVVPTLAALGLPGAGPCEPPEELRLTLGDDLADAEPIGEPTDDFGGFADSPLFAAADGGDEDGGEEEVSPAVAKVAAETRRADGSDLPSGDGLFAGADPVIAAAHGDALPPRDPAAGELTETAARSEIPATADLPALGERLAKLGASRLTLEKSRGGFYFGCTVAAPTGPGGPTVARRFEAEADSPAAAAADVLAQVERFTSTASAADVALVGGAR